MITGTLDSRAILKFIIQYMANGSHLGFDP